MFFNMLLKTADDLSECDSQLRAAIREPKNEESAAAALTNFKTYVEKVGQQVIAAGGDARSKPKESSVPYFISYFWQIQNRDVWPVYYTSSVQANEDMNLWQETGNVGNDYPEYKRLHETLLKIFSEAAGRHLTLYDVEHVFWFKSRQSLAGDTAVRPAATPEKPAATAPATGAEPALAEPPQALLPDSYVPPIVGVIPKLALNDPELQEAARRSGMTLERALEKSINAAFIVLGYETTLLGQGKGRVPDGQAIAVDDQYAIVWDAKARADGYKMGTDDRVIRDYIDTQSRILKRRGSILKVYYLIISSSFSDEFDELIETLKMQTNVNEVCLMETAALVAVVNQKLRAPLDVSLGSDGLQRLFTSSGVITEDTVLEKLA